MKIQVVIRINAQETRTELINTDHVASATYVDNGVNTRLVMDIINRPSLLILEGYMATKTFTLMQSEYDAVVKIQDVYNGQ